MTRVVAWGFVALTALTACGRFGFSAQDTVNGSDANGGPDTGSSASMFDAGVDAALGPSCVGLPATCGPTGTSSCCGSPLVPGGSFARSYDGSNDDMFSDMSYPATIGDFRLDTYEVTVGRFRAFVAAGMGTQASPPAAGDGAHAQIANSGWDSSWNGNLDANTTQLIADLSCNSTYETWTDTAGSNENLAMNCITWFESFAFCAWDGGYLPTEAEWNYAAAGGNEQRSYPWSSPADSTTIDCTYANFSLPSGYCVDPPTGAVTAVGAYSPKGDGRWGQADLAGNLWEKTLDTYESPYTVTPCDNCADLTSDEIRSVRGGAFNGVAASARTGDRYYDPPYDRYIEMGVRCARNP